LEGSARKVAGQVRINVQLVDASTGNQVWGQRYDKQFRDIFKLQDEIVQSLIATLNLQLTVLNQGYVLPQRTKNLQAYDYYMRAFEYFMSLTPDGFAKARKMFEKAIKLDSGYADAYAFLSLSFFVGWIWQWDPDPGVLDRAAELANKSIALDDSESGAYAVLGWIAAEKTSMTKPLPTVSGRSRWPPTVLSATRRWRTSTSFLAQGTWRRPSRMLRRRCASTRVIEMFT
jgi:tetratricopeptide (TPR) repeat protein